MKLRARKKGSPLAVNPISGNISRLKNCKFCAEEFASMDECARHIVQRHLLELKLCPRCSRAFTVQAELDKHMDKHSKRSYSIYSCSRCPIYYANHALLERHEFEKHEEAPAGLYLVRYYPYLSAYVKTNFVRFFKRLRLNSTVFRCSLCRKVFGDVKLYIKHMKTACSTKLFVCDRCICVFPSKNTFVNHFKNKHCQKQDMLSLVLNTKKKRIQCVKCKSRFDSHAPFEAHFKLCSMSAYTCADCNISFRLVKDYHTHQVEFHAVPVQTQTCKYCRMEFISVKSLERHLKQHEKYSCLGCDRKFQYPSPLLHHIKTQHTEVEPYLCNVCNISFKDKVKFSLHIKEEHKGRGAIKFDDKFFVTFSENVLVTINITEDSIEPLLDEDSAALQFDDLEKDEGNSKTKADDASASDDDQPLLVRKKKQPKSRGIMMAIKSYFCKFCGKRSSSHDKYRKHIKGHFRAGVKQCMHCAKFFKNAAVLAEHVDEKHKPGQVQGTSKLRRLLQMRAQRKMEALKATRTKAAVNFKIHNATKNQPELLAVEWPTKIKAIKVAEPTYEFLQSNPQVRTTGMDVKIRFHRSPPPGNKIGDLTAQKYVEMFRPDSQPARPDAKLFTLNRSMKIKSIRSTVANRMFKIQMKKFNTTERTMKPGLAMPVPCRPDRSPQTEVTVRLLEEAEVTHNPHNLNFDLHEEQPVIYDDFYNAEYFETDDHDANVAQIEILSTNAGLGSQVVQAVRYESEQEEYYIVEAEPSTREIEGRLTEVCRSLEVPDSVQHIGGLTQSAPYFKIVDIKNQEVNKKHAPPVRVAYAETVSFGGKTITLVNPLEHLMKKSNIQIKVEAPEKDYGAIIAKSLEKLGGL